MAGSEQQWSGWNVILGNQGSTARAAVTCTFSDSSVIARSFLNTVHSDLLLVCTAASITPLGDARAAGGPSTARIELSYVDPINQAENTVQNDWDNWKEHWGGGGDAVELGAGYMWSDTSDSIGTEGGPTSMKIIPQAAITLTGTTNKSVVAGKTYIKNLLGKVNSDNITIKGFVYSDQTLLFEGADMDEGQDSEGSDTRTISFKFSAMFDHTWNQFWRQSDPPGWFRVKDSNDAPPYTAAVFSDLDPSNW